MYRLCPKCNYELCWLDRLLEECTMCASTLPGSITKEDKMYVRPNFKHKKQLKEAVAKGDQVIAFNPGINWEQTPNGKKLSVEGPHFPYPHTWYATVDVENGVVIRVY